MFGVKEEWSTAEDNIRICDFLPESYNMSFFTNFLQTAAFKWVYSTSFSPLSRETLWSASSEDNQPRRR